MRRDLYGDLCQALEAGAEKYVENIHTHETGKVLDCKEDWLEVEVRGKHKSWPSEICAETRTSTSFMKFKP